MAFIDLFEGAAINNSRHQSTEAGFEVRGGGVDGTGTAVLVSPNGVLSQTLLCRPIMGS